MADTKISALTVGTPALVTDQIPAARSGANVQLTPQDILAAPVTANVSKAFTPAGTTTWYRLGSFPASNLGQHAEIIVMVLRSLGGGHHQFKLRLSKTTTGAGTGVTAEYQLLGIFISGAYCLAEVRVVDAGLNGATHVDVRFANTDAYTVYVQALSNVATGTASLAFTPDTNMTSQGTGAAGSTLDAQGTQYAMYNVTLGWFYKVGVLGSVASSASYGQFGNAATVFGNSSAALAANADLDVNTTGFGVLIIARQNNDGGVGLFAMENGLGTMGEIYDSAGRFAVGADPGAGSNQIWVAGIAGPGVRLRNRYGVAKNVSVAVLSLGGTPA
jgi:hypothetical protein